VASAIVPASAPLPVGSVGEEAASGEELPAGEVAVPVVRATSADRFENHSQIYIPKRSSVHVVMIFIASSLSSHVSFTQAFSIEHPLL